MDEMKAQERMRGGKKECSGGANYVLQLWKAWLGVRDGPTSEFEGIHDNNQHGWQKIDYPTLILALVNP